MRRRTQIVVLELRPGASQVEVGQVIGDELMSTDVVGWVVTAQEPVEEES